MKERKLVLIEWEDIYTTTSEWRSEEEATIELDSTESLVRQTGFHIEKDEEHVVVTCSYIPGLDLLGTAIRIPTPTVKAIYEMSYEDFKKFAKKV